MTDKKEVYDGLKCGNCGYDGGETHLKEKLEWQKEMHKLELKAQLSGDTIRNRHVTIGAVVVFCTLICAITYAMTRPEQPKLPENPAIVRMRSLAEMYEKCMYQVSQMERAEKPTSINNCNNAFKTEMEKVVVENQQEIK